MESFYSSIFLLVCLSLIQASATENDQVYIVYFGGHSEQKTVQEIEESHHSYLFSVKENEEDAKRSLIYSYTKNINGFAAHLTREEASKLSEMEEEVVSVFPSLTYSLHTTRSWNFTRLLEGNDLNNFEEEEEHSLLKSEYGKDVIVGFVDTGVWPESESFNDIGMGPIPNSWKGSCRFNDALNSSRCNKKIIGAKYYIKGYEAENGKLEQGKDYRSPRDIDGHGTHTSSTACGRVVQNVSALGGYARGTATGGAPLARLAIYKVCWPKGCSDSDILAAIDDAIADGVNVLSISMGSLGNPIPYHKDIIAIGALHAIKKNIAVAYSAGNEGPTSATAVNLAPWGITVGASSVDRKFSSLVVLGNGTRIAGESISPYKLQNKLYYPLAYAGQIVNPNVSTNLSGQCLRGSLSPKKAKGKIILCFRGEETRVGIGMEVKRAGGVGLILGNNKDNGDGYMLDAHFLPSISINYNQALVILDYIGKSKKPDAYFVAGNTVLGVKPAPTTASLSSRGPNTLSPDILKPDITAPGLNILAAYSEGTSPTGLAGDNRVVKYNILSGTSMSCPHVSGALAILKGMHPDWSSAALRSALITSAGLRNNEVNLITDASGNPADPFQIGSGHFRPTKAADPGLVYDASYTDYLLFLCSSGYVKNMDPTFKCPKHRPSAANLNYPSLAIPKLNGSVTVVRTVTNVGSASINHTTTYTVSVKTPLGISIEISPPTLHFNRVGQKMNFTITVKTNPGRFIEKGGYLFGWYLWSDGIHNVRSPMAIAVA